VWWRIVLKYFVEQHVPIFLGYALKYTWLEADDNSHLSVNAFSIWLLANFLGLYMFQKSRLTLLRTIVEMMDLQIGPSNFGTHVTFLYVN